MKNIDWKVIAQDGEARAGILRTRRSEIETPVFMPVGTQGTVKGIRYEWLEDGTRCADNSRKYISSVASSRNGNHQKTRRSA